MRVSRKVKKRSERDYYCSLAKGKLFKDTEEAHSVFRKLAIHTLKTIRKLPKGVYLQTPTLNLRDLFHLTFSSGGYTAPHYFRLTVVDKNLKFIQKQEWEEYMAILYQLAPISTLQPYEKELLALIEKTPFEDLQYPVYLILKLLKEITGKNTLKEFGDTSTLRHAKVVNYSAKAHTPFVYLLLFKLGFSVEFTDKFYDFWKRYNIYLCLKS